MSRLSTCSTGTSADEDVARGGSVPPPAAPCAVHVTDQSMVATTLKASSSAPPASVDCPADETA